MKKSEQRFSVVYHITLHDSQNIEEVARDIAVEQTVEVPYDCIPKEHFNQGLVGQVEAIEHIQGESPLYQVVISYRCDISGFSVPQLLNVLFGNISLKDNIRLVHFSIPGSLQSVFPGPRYGILGLREVLGVYGRPLACTALKPMGLSAGELADKADSYARGGVDIVKDDHGIADQGFSPFRERVELCQKAVERASAHTGRRTLYFPMISGGFDQIEDQVRYAVSHGVKGILIAPMLVGLDTVRYLSQQYGVIIMTHPALTGVYFHDRKHGMTPAVLLGTLFRLLGVDISIFPNAGGRFHFTTQECADLAWALRESRAKWRGSLPCPAGGMQVNRIGDVVRFFGEDTVILIGGSVMQRHADLSQGTRDFMEEIRSCANEELSKPASEANSSCEIAVSDIQTDTLGLLKCTDFRWSSREASQYAVEDDGRFKDITRHELVGRFGENTKFDVRYFEIGPGGYSSLEKHVHEHIIIGVRGEGILLKGGQQIVVNIHDVAYVGPLAVHQLLNRGKEPFGFFCIVDHKRDRPIVV
ncbi:MAG: RuBisCO large subunit C-terminal-like domain-containing protein [Chloroflexota bacterium]|nr:RuBisCO large subunit C-terminal-like domain-containing protein [Chloroflexota bacterium]